MNQLKKLWDSVKGGILRATTAVKTFVASVVSRVVDTCGLIGDKINEGKNALVSRSMILAANIQVWLAAKVTGINAWTGESVARYVLVLPLVGCLQLAEVVLKATSGVLVMLLVLTVGESLLIASTLFFAGFLTPMFYGVIRITASSMIDTTMGTMAAVWLGSLIAVLTYSCVATIATGVRRLQEMLDLQSLFATDVVTEVPVSRGDTQVLQTTEDVVAPAGQPDVAIVSSISDAVSEAVGQLPVTPVIRTPRASRKDRQRSGRQSVLLQALQAQYSQENGGLGLEG